MRCPKVVVILILTIVGISSACLPMNDVFKYSTLWQQGISVPDRHIIVVGQDKEEKVIQFENERNDRLLTYTCLEDHGQHRFMMKVELPLKESYYQCIKFTGLTPRVVRIAKSDKNNNKGKLNCGRTNYMEDAAVLIAYLDIPTQPCQLQGGFQMRLQETDSTEKDMCVQHGWGENPSLQFGCGPGTSVVAQFGRHCCPKILKDAQKMRRRYLTHLNCVSSWEEPDKGNFILLKMRDMYTSFWCLNYVRSNNGEILSAYLSFDGRCTSKPASFDPASRHGHLISYIPASDSRCSGNGPRECRHFYGDCSKSNDCPGKCNRCLSERKKANCWFLLNTPGHWQKSGGARNSLEVEVFKSNFTVTGQGKFQCTDFAERSLPGKIYPVVHYSPVPSCMPYHACSEVVSPASGLLNFFVRPAATENGKISSCYGTHELFGDVIPIDVEREFTLIKPEALENTSCNIMERKTFSSYMPDCRFAVEQCSGLCDEFEVGPDKFTCNKTFERLDKKHTCLARLPFRGGHHGIVTKSNQTGRYFCWIFSKDNRLLIAPVEQCNSEGVRLLLTYYMDEYRNDPLFALLEVNSVAHGEGGGGDGNGSRASFVSTRLLFIFATVLGVLETLAVL